MNNENYGSLWLQKTSSRFTRAPSPLEQTQQLLAALTETPPPATSNTTPATITNCIQIGTLYKIEASTLAWGALLRFDLSKPARGDYEFQLNVAAQHPPHETGVIQNVTTVEGHNQYFQMYAPTENFPTRFSIVSRSSHGELRFWHIGIFHCKCFDPSELANEPSA